MKPSNYCMGLAGVWLSLSSMVIASDADPTFLPLADRSPPDWDAYTTLGVRTAAAGFYYDDPATGTKVFKLTADDTPVANTFAFHDYSEGGPLISAEWGDGMHTIILRVMDDSPSYSTWLVDYKQGDALTKVSNYSSPGTIDYPVYVDTALYSAGSSIVDVILLDNN